MESSKASSLTYNATKQFVIDNYPEIERFFDDVWKLYRKNDPKASIEQNLGMAHFLNNETVILIIQVVIPFLSGTFSAVTADVIWEKIKKSRTRRKFEIEVITKDVKSKIEIGDEFAQKLLPYVLNEIQKEINTEN